MEETNVHVVEITNKNNVAIQIKVRLLQQLKILSNN